MNIPKKFLINVVEPPITSFPHYASPLSLIYGYENAKKWFCNSYVNLYTDFRHLGNGEIKFRQELVMNYCPFLRFGAIDDYRYLTDKDITIDKLKNILCNNYALAINIDRYYIPSINKKYHLIHCVYLYGYDDEKEEFYISDFASESGKFIFTTVPYNAMQEALGIVKNSEYTFKNTSKKFFINLYGIHDSEYNFDIKQLHHKLKDYYNSENTIDCVEMFDFYKMDDKVMWGLGVYRWLIEYMTVIKRESRSNIDIRPIYVLLDHKKAMLIRINYLQSENYIHNHDDLKQEYNMLSYRLSILLSLAIKYNATKKIEILDKMISLVSNVIDLDRNATCHFIHSIST